MRFLLRESEDHSVVEEVHGVHSVKSCTKKVFKLNKKRSRTRLHLGLELIVSSLKGQSTKDNVSSQRVSCIFSIFRRSVKIVDNGFSVESQGMD